MLFSVQSLTQAPTVYQPSPIPPFCDYSYLTFPFSYPRLLAKLILQAPQLQLQKNYFFHCNLLKASCHITASVQPYQPVMQPHPPQIARNMPHSQQIDLDSTNIKDLETLATSDVLNLVICRKISNKHWQNLENTLVK